MSNLLFILKLKKIILLKNDLLIFNMATTFLFFTNYTKIIKKKNKLFFKIHKFLLISKF